MLSLSSQFIINLSSNTALIHVKHFKAARHCKINGQRCVAKIYLSFETIHLSHTSLNTVYYEKYDVIIEWFPFLTL